MRRTHVSAALVTAVLVLGLLAGCQPPFIRERIPNSYGGHSTPKVALGAAKAVKAQLLVSVGSLKVRSKVGGQLMEGDFDYKPLDWKPTVDYSVDGTAGTLRVEQPDGRPFPVGSARNDWDVTLDRDVPMDLTVRMSAGKTDLRLAGMNLTSLKVLGGAGETTIDLVNGAPPRNGELSADITAGVGKLTLRVPKGAGVEIFGWQDGIGKFDAPGFTKRDDNTMYNDAANGDPKAFYRIRLQRGVGEVTIEQF